jgi:coenzyme F420-reducing hydrogenase beta subunit
MAMTKFGALVAQLDKLSAEELTIADSVCPFSDSAQDEDRLGLDLFGGVLDHFHSKTGYYRSIRVGRIASDDVVQSSSGGLTTYLLSQLFDAGEIDGVIHVGESKDEGRLFSYALSQTRDELLGRRKSQYYPTEFSEVMLSVRGNGKRYAIVGTPCFIKASQLLAERDPVLRNQLVWRIAICCGHLKSAAFAEALAWQLGISPPDLDRVDFRVKRDGAPAYAYSFGAVARSDERWRSKPSIELFGGDWGLALFQLKACEFCDDIFGETADICFGDAWLSPFDRDWRGTNIVLSRSPTLDALLEHGSQRNEIWLDDLPLKSLIASQAGAFRHRWYGIATRLADARRRGEEVPRKRKSCYSRRTPFLLNEIIRARQKISRKSHELFLKAKECDDFEILVKGLRGDIDALIRLQRFDKFLHPYSILRKGLRVFSRIGNWMSRQR